MDNKYRGSLWENTNYFIFLVIFTAIIPLFSPFDFIQQWLNSLFLPQLDISSLKGMESYREAYQSEKNLIYFVQFLPVLFFIGFWIWKRGLLPAIKPEERQSGIIVVIIANVLLLVGAAVFAYIASQAKGGGSISGVPLGLWFMACAFVGWIGVVLVEWRRWNSVSKKVTIMQVVVLIVLLSKPIQTIFYMFIR